MGSHNRRHLRPKFVHVGTLGVAAGAIALAGQASAQSVNVDGQGFVAISLSGWSLERRARFGGNGKCQRWATTYGQPG